VAGNREQSSTADASILELAFRYLQKDVSRAELVLDSVKADWGLIAGTMSETASIIWHPKSNTRSAALTNRSSPESLSSFFVSTIGIKRMSGSNLIACGIGAQGGEPGDAAHAGADYEIVGRDVYLEPDHVGSTV
jgi:hypothetical protein